MDVIEKAIRNAFEKGNPDDRAFREKVYRSAFAALDRALAANPNVAAGVGEKRRQGLQAKITEIESEYIPAVAEAAPTPVAADPFDDLTQALTVEQDASEVAPNVDPARTSPEPQFQTGPSVSDPLMSGLRVDPPLSEARIEQTPPSGRFDPPMSFDDGAMTEREPDIVEALMAIAPDGPPPPVSRDAFDPEVMVSVDPDAAVRRERRRPVAAIFLAVTLFVLLGMGAWWAVQTGLLKTPEERNTEVPNPPKTLDNENFIPEEENNAPVKPGAADEARNWVTVFTPSDPTLVAAPGGTKAEVMKDDSGAYLRISSSGSDASIVFDVGQGILEKIAGKHAVFDIVARGEEGKETQMSVDCNFGELGDCGRKRYAVGYERGDFLFEIEMPKKAPGSGGTIAINPDISNGGKAVDIYEIRVSTTE